MDPNIWGPKGWFFIHNVALVYPRNPTISDRENYKTFFKTLGNVLPCPICQVHYKTNLVEEELNNALNSNIDLFRWSVDMHNKVNSINEKKIISYEEALNSLNMQYQNNTNYSFWIIIICGIIILLFLKN